MAALMGGPFMKIRTWLFLALCLLEFTGCAQWKAAVKNPYRSRDVDTFPFGYEPG